ncbi:MAG: DUF2058 family protein [Methylococcaceae bacterium]|nr:DUF2058 family protein [Methylococcaceae bacterium]
MAKSLQEQLLGAGLISDSKAKTAKTNKRKQTKAQRKNKAVVEDNTKQQLAEAKAEQVEKDRLLNQQKQQQAEQKAIVAQVKQLIDTCKVPQDKEGEAYNFSDGATIKKIYVDTEKREQIAKGRLAIVKLEGRYEIVTAEVAAKISQRDETAVVLLNDRKTEDKAVEDDAYADYQIPDDLMW